MGKKRAHGKRGGTREAMQRLAAAYAEVSAARAALAAASVVGQEPAHPDAAYEHLAAHRARLLATPGVVGVGIGLRKQQPVISIFTRPTSDGSRWLDESLVANLTTARLGAGIPIGVEVVPFGNLRPPPAPVPVAHGIDSIIGPLKTTGTATLAPGDGVGQVSPATRGTLGYFAHARNRAAVGITAMHVIDDVSDVGDGDDQIPIVRRADVSSPGVRIGAIDRGTRTGIDAARVRLDSGVDASWDIPSMDDILGWRWACAADIRWPARLYGAKSRRLDGVITQVEAHFAFENGTFDRAIVASIPTVEGDSGAALVDSHGYVLGFLAGTSDILDSSLRIFSSAGLVLKHLECNIP